MALNPNPARPPEATTSGTLSPLSQARRDPPNERLAPKAVVGRLSLYLRQLELFERQGLTTVSSRRLGAALGIGDAQVRKDLAFFGQFGYPGVGYRIEELGQSLRRVMGIDHEWPLALVGLGNLGRALLKYRGFRARGFRVAALFDNDPKKVGHNHNGLAVEPIDACARVLAERHITLAVLSVPAEAAQHVADHLIAAGIVGILNFAPVTLALPPHVNIVAVDLSVQLENLAYLVANTEPRPAALRLPEQADGG